MFDSCCLAKSFCTKAREHLYYTHWFLCANGAVESSVGYSILQ